MSGNGSLLAAIAKGIGVGALEVGKYGFREQEQAKDVEARKAEQKTGIDAATANLKTEMDARERLHKEEMDFTRGENQKGRDHDAKLAQIAADRAAAVAYTNASSEHRIASGKNLIGQFEALEKRIVEVQKEYKDNPEQAEAIVKELRYQGATWAAHPVTAALLHDAGGDNVLAYYASFDLGTDGKGGQGAPAVDPATGQPAAATSQAVPPPRKGALTPGKGVLGNVLVPQGAPSMVMGQTGERQSFGTPVDLGAALTRRNEENSKNDKPVSGYMYQNGYR